MNRAMFKKIGASLIILMYLMGTLGFAAYNCSCIPLLETEWFTDDCCSQKSDCCSCSTEKNDLCCQIEVKSLDVDADLLLQNFTFPLLLAVNMSNSLITYSSIGAPITYAAHYFNPLVYSDIFYRFCQLRL